MTRYQSSLATSLVVSRTANAFLLRRVRSQRVVSSLRHGEGRLGSEGTLESLWNFMLDDRSPFEASLTEIGEGG